MPTEHAILISVTEASHRLGLGYVKTWQLVTSGELRSIRVGTRRLVPVTCLAEFISRKLADDGKARNQSA